MADFLSRMYLDARSRNREPAEVFGHRFGCGGDPCDQLSGWQVNLSFAEIHVNHEPFYLYPGRSEIVFF